MKVVVFDPQLSRSGHHVSFNSQIVMLLSTLCSEVIYIDVSNCLGEFLDYPNVVFRNLKWSDVGRPEEGEVSIDNYQKNMSKEDFCLGLLSYVDTLNPDLVILTSEGNFRSPLYMALEKVSRRKVYIVVHVIWSFLKTLKDSPKLYAAIKKISGTLVLEPFLTKHLRSIGLNCDWFPLRSYKSEPELAISDKALGDLTSFGTVGVINERRNNNFIIDSLKYVTAGPVKYVLAGELRDKVKPDVIKSLAQLEGKTNIVIETKYGYLDDHDFFGVLLQLDYGILAYDVERNLQASAAVYSYTQVGVPLVVPRIDLFVEYAAYYPGLFVLYNPLDPKNLAGVIDQLTQEQIDDFRKYYLASRKSFFATNREDIHLSYLENLFK